MTGVSPAIGAGRDEHVRLPIQPALEKGYSYRTKVEFDVRLFFGGSKMPDVAKRLRAVAKNAKSNAVGRSDQEACDIAFVSAVAGLQEQARKAGGDAVVNIKSNYRGENLDSASEYVCGAGNLVVGVTLEGTAVRLKK